MHAVHAIVNSGTITWTGRRVVAMAVKTIGFVGTGVMGRGMIRNLMKAGFTLQVFNRTKSKADDLIAEGAVWKASPAETAAGADAVITMVGYPEDVASVYFDNGIIDHAKPGACLIDMTTSSPQLAEKIDKAAAAKELYALDAPVSGGDVGAREGTLSIMIGGDPQIAERLMPVFQAMGRKIVYQGKAGSGQHTKMANQIAIASNMIGVAEALAYARRAGLDADKVMESIETGAAGSWSLSNLGRRMLKGDFAPGFYIKHLIKDERIALESSESLGLATPGLALSKKIYDELAANGEENSGTQAIYKKYL
ncbi:NAD(P)-dependent oxidoreductase [Sporolactobacillus sp. CPB3-1]|uniref:NAD(P)-dependent oxidoreductase n=1 Tax=Sporolactobacillus mangiferae TaxID=2940498 RepID=A0ABT0MAN0_9BACL|nr:NAD(P)-dependent oxidoreductase [Sporolactobacillus mangiferae]MCL1631339.1 NAD(P)-dependent oxidoreductase [Sporolactobacillus mangiferae]